MEYESVVQTMEKEFRIVLMSIESVKEQVRSKYKRLSKKLNLKDNELALNAQVKNEKGKGYFKMRQGLKGTCRICGKYGHKVIDCWENDKKKMKGVTKKLQGRCNYCGMYSHKEADCKKKKMKQSIESDRQT